MSGQEKNILFIRLRLMGDIIFTIPAVQKFHSAFPDTRIFYVAENKFAPVARLIPHVHQVVTVPRKMNIKEISAFRNWAKKMNFSRVIDFHSGPKSALLTRISGIPQRIGYRTPNRNWAYNCLSPRWEKNRNAHSVENQVRLLDHLGIPREPVPDYPDIPVDYSLLNSRVTELLGMPGKIVIHVGAGNRFREWELANYSGLARLLLNHGLQVILIGNTEKEIARGRALGKDLPVRDFTGRLTIPDTLGLIADSSVYVGVDSGPLHLASLTRTPIVAIYGPNIPEISGPWRKSKVTIIQRPLNCRPCSQKKCRYDTIRCMREIKIDHVFKAVLQYLF